MGEWDGDALFHLKFHMIRTTGLELVMNVSVAPVMSLNETRKDRQIKPWLVLLFHSSNSTPV